MHILRFISPFISPYFPFWSINKKIPTQSGVKIIEGDRRKKNKKSYHPRYEGDQQI
jgi:hypothetical protein